MSSTNDLSLLFSTEDNLEQFENDLDKMLR